METIIEEQEKEFKERFTLEWWVSLKKEDIKRLGLAKIFKYHKKYMRQILQALVEKEEKEKKIETWTENACPIVSYENIAFNKAKQDTIQYLQEQIKKL